MSEQYPGGFITKTTPTVSTSSAQGMWTLSQQAGYQKQGLWPIPPVITVGASATYKASAQLQFTCVCTLSTTASVIVYVDYTNDGIYAVVATRSGTTLTYGTPVLVRSGFSPQNATCAALSATTVVVCYETTASNHLGTKVLTISGTSISVGAEATNGAVTQYPSVVPLTSTTALCAYSVGAVVITVSGTTASYGTGVNFTGSSNGTIQLSSISSTKAILARINGSNSNYPTVNVVTVSGTTVTMGANYVVEAISGSTSSPWIGIAATSASGAISTWKTASGDLPKAVAMTISGTAVTFGAVQNLGSVALEGSANQSMAPVSATQAIFVYSVQSTGYLGAYVLTSSGTTLTASLPTETLALNAGRASVAQMSGNIFLNPYRVGTSYGAAQVLTVV